MSDTTTKTPEASTPEASTPAQSRGRSGAPPVGRRFEKGKSGNPGGRSKLSRQLERDFLGDCPEMRELLLKLARDEGAPWAQRLRAIEIIIARGMGRIPEAVVASASPGNATIILQQLAPGTPPPTVEEQGVVDGE